MMTIDFVWVQRINFLKDAFSFNHNFISYNFKKSLENIFIKELLKTESNQSFSDHCVLI